MSYYSRNRRKGWGRESYWPAYVPVAERRRKAEAEMEKLRKKGHPVAPVKIEGRVIARTFWGKAWCDNLESYRDFENRIARGRTYVRNGSVVDLQIAPREVAATVSGSELYKVTVSIADVPKQQWGAICADCAGGIDSLVELLQGRFSQSVMQRICRQGEGLFPKPSEIRFTCSCPDYASMCKHIAAVLYGVGARLDANPELLFRLRAVDENDLVARLDASVPLAKAGPAAGKVLEGDDLSALFGLEMDGGDASGEAAPPGETARKAKPGRGKTAGRKAEGAGKGAGGTKRAVAPAPAPSAAKKRKAARANGAARAPVAPERDRAAPKQTRAGAPAKRQAKARAPRKVQEGQHNAAPSSLPQSGRDRSAQRSR